MVLSFNELVGQARYSQPFIHNYDKNQYQAGTQNWGFTQGINGEIYIANNDGLLEFNGTDWNTYKLPGKTICRSVLWNDNRIYVGGQGEFGFFEQNELGALNYVKIPFGEQANPTDIWKIIPFDDYIYFFSFEGLFRYDKQNNVCKFYFPGSSSVFIGLLNEELIIQTTESGIVRLKDESFERIATLDPLQGYIVTSVITHSDSLTLFTTLRNGIFRMDKNVVTQWKTNVDEFLKESAIYCAANISNGSIVLGTSQGGVLFLNTSGQAEMHLNKQKGLLKNNTLSMFEDNDKNLWLGLDNGIDYIEVNSGFEIVHPDGFLLGTSYAAARLNDQLFIGTNNGLFYTNWTKYQHPIEEPGFRNFNGMSGQVWGLNTIENTLFINHHTGLYYTKGEALQKAFASNGSWLIQPLNGQKNYYIEGTYEGMNIYKQEGSKIKFINSIEGFKESSRFIAQDESGFIWVAHPYKGVFRCKLGQDLTSFTEVKKYGASNGFPSDLMLKVFTLNNQIYFVAEKGVYQYKADEDKMVEVESLSRIIGEDLSIRLLSQGDRESIWYVNQDEVGVLKINYDGIEQKIEKFSYPQVNGMMVDGFEFITQVDQNQVLMGAENGMILFNTNFKTEKPVPKQALITSVILSLEEDSLLGQRIISNSMEDIEFAHDLNNFIFKLSSPVYNGHDVNRVSYILEGFDDSWSPWTVQKVKEYTNLPSGKFVFKVKGRMADNSETLTASYGFTIHPPWYRTYAFAIVIGILIAFVMFSLVFFPRKRYKQRTSYLKREQELQLLEKQKEIQANENEMMRLKNEKLEDEINFKNQELASSTMHIVQKTEILHKIRTELKKANNEISNREVVNGQIKKVLGLIKDNVRLDKNWDQFAQNFDRVHVDFNKRLRDNYPVLSSNDLKLCAYLRMNLSTKDIAPLLNISVRGVEISRYRLRKKLELDRNTSLYEFLTKI